MLAHLPTPVEALDRLGQVLGFAPGQLLVKRDDATGLAGGGNKARKLELLCAHAVAQGCDTLVTGGGAQSNHARMTTAAANRLGMDCTVVLAGDQPDVPSGNVLLDHVLGADIVWAGPLDYAATEAAIEDSARQLRDRGRRPYAIPVGGASPLGARAYVGAARELSGQVGEVDLVVTADGSGGTHAGLAVGFGDFDRVLGVDVGARTDLSVAVPAMAAAVAELEGVAEPRGRCRIDRAQVGEGYGARTEACRDAIRLAARLEGLLLDPVYTGKALAALVAGVESGRIDRTERVVFLHTGGLPAVFAYRYAGWLAENQSR